MELSEHHRRFLRIEQCVHPGLVNVVFNGVIAWLLTRSLAAIPLWGDVSMGVDLLATAFLLPLITCLIVSRLIRAQVASGKLSALEPEQIASQGLHHQSTWVRGVVLGVVGLLFAGLPLVVLLELADAQPVAQPAFVAFKALWAGGLAMLISPVIAWWALSAASHAAPVTATN